MASLYASSRMGSSPRECEERVAETIKSIVLTLSFTVLICSIAGLCFAIVPGSIFAYLQSSGVLNWSIRPSSQGKERRLRSGWLLLAAWTGGTVGCACALSSLLPAANLDLYLYPHLLRDGQGGFVVIGTGLVFGVLGSLLAIGGCRLFLCSEATRVFTFPPFYSGNHRLLNKTVFTLAVVGGLMSMWLGSFLANWVQFHPGWI